MKNKNAGCVYGYVRVSSADQNEERQRIAMAQEGLKRQGKELEKTERRRASKHRK